MPKKEYLIAKTFGKTLVEDKNLILGNSEIMINSDEIKTAKVSNSYYSGTLGAQSWKIKKVSIYNFV